MRMLATALVIGLALAAPGAAQRGRADDRAQREQAALDREFAGLVPGQPIDCLPTLPRTDTKGYGRTLVFSVSPRLKYRNDTAGGCEGVGRDDILVTRSNYGRLCRGDISQTVDRASRISSGSCALGDFVPYRRP